MSSIHRQDDPKVPLPLGEFTTLSLLPSHVHLPRSKARVFGLFAL
jgi:hypothetical protein